MRIPILTLASVIVCLIAIGLIQLATLAILAGFLLLLAYLLQGKTGANWRCFDWKRPSVWLAAIAELIIIGFGVYCALVLWGAIWAVAILVIYAIGTIG